MESKYSKEEIREALRTIEGQMNYKYLDIGCITDEIEFDLVWCAIQEYKKNHNLEEDNDGCKM